MYLKSLIFLCFLVPQFLWGKVFVFDITGSRHGQGDVVGVFSIAEGMRQFFPEDSFYLVYDRNAEDILTSTYGKLEDISSKVGINFIHETLFKTSEVELEADYSFQTFFGGRWLHHFTDLAWNTKDTVHFIVDTMHGDTFDEVRFDGFHIYFKPAGVGPKRSGILKDPNVRRIEKILNRKSKQEQRKIIAKFFPDSPLQQVLKDESLKIAFAYGVHNETVKIQRKKPVERLQGQTRSYLEALFKNHTLTSPTVVLTPHSPDQLREAGVPKKRILTLDTPDLLNKIKKRTKSVAVLSLGKLNGLQFNGLIAIADEPILGEGNNTLSGAIQLGKKFIVLESPWNYPQIQDFIDFEKSLGHSNFTDNYPKGGKANLEAFYDELGDNQIFYERLKLAHKKLLPQKLSELVLLVEEYRSLMKSKKTKEKRVGELLLLQKQAQEKLRDEVLAISLAAEAAKKEKIPSEALTKTREEYGQNLNWESVLKKFKPNKPNLSAKSQFLERKRPLPLSDEELKFYPSSFNQTFKDRFQGLYVINLDDHEPSAIRRTKMQEFFSETPLSLQFFQAIYGKDISYKQHNPSVQTLREVSTEGFPITYKGSPAPGGLSAGELGNYLSHFFLWKMVAEDPNPDHIYLLSEDDITPLDNFTDRFKSMLAHAPEDWELIFLYSNQGEDWGCHHGDYDDYDSFDETSSKRFIRLEKACTPGLVTYALNSKGARILMDNALPLSLPSDVLVGHKLIGQKKIKAYAAYPEIVTTIVNGKDSILNSMGRNYSEASPKIISEDKIYNNQMGGLLNFYYSVFDRRGDKKPLHLISHWSDLTEEVITDPIVFLDGESTGPRDHDKYLDQMLYIGPRKDTGAALSLQIPFASTSYSERDSSPMSLISNKLGEVPDKPYFAAYLASNCVQKREKAFDQLIEFAQKNKLGEVHALGRCFGSHPETKHSIPEDFVRTKGNFMDTSVKIYQPYKYVLTFENAKEDGYVTEKIVSPFLARSVPIYWGSDYVFTMFQKPSFIFVQDDISEVLTRENFSEEAWRTQIESQKLTEEGEYLLSWHEKVHQYFQDMGKKSLKQRILEALKELNNSREIRQKPSKESKEPE